MDKGSQPPASGFWRFLLPPRSRDLEQTQKARFLHVALAVTTLGAVPLAIVNHKQGAATFASLLWAVSLLSLVGLRLNATGRTSLAAGLLGTIFYGATVFTIIDGAGLADPGVLAMPILILLATFYLGRGAALASTTLSIGTLAILQQLVAAGILHLPGSYSSARLIVDGVLLLGMAALAWVVSTAWEGSLAGLRESESRLELAARGARLGVWDWDIHSDTIRAEGEWIREAGIHIPGTYDEWMGRLHPDDRTRVVDSLDRHLQGEGSSWSAEYRTNDDGGGWRWRLALGRVTGRDGDGRPTRMSGVVLDVHENRQAQERLSASDRRYRLLSQELHDSITQTLYSVRLTLEAARLAMDRDRDRAAGLLAQVDGLTKNALDELRNLLRQGRPEALEQQGLVAALGDHIAGLRARGELEVDYEVVGDRALTVEQELALYRGAQEALSNVSKHSGVRQARVKIDLTRDPLVLEVEDAGAGMGPATEQPRNGGLGLDSMRERIEALGGIFAVASTPGKGTRLRFEIPVLPPGAPSGH